MKRFGWSRPALLIGFVLSKSLEDAVYRTIQIYGFDFLLRPLALGLLLFAIGFIWFMVRTKSKALNDDLDPRAVLTKKAQIAFTLSMAVVVAIFMIDSLKVKFLAAVFPFSAGIITLSLLVILWLTQRRAIEGSAHLVDLESSAQTGETRSFRSTAPFVLGIPVLSAILGFEAGVFVFTLFLLRFRADKAWRFAITYAVLILAFFWGLAQILSLSYPEGLLQYGLALL
jgi:hypothetical protein